MAAKCVLVILFTLAASACVISPTHTELVNQTLPRVVPVRQFVANADYQDNFQISPDGSKLVYQGVSQLRSAIIWRNVQFFQAISEDNSAQKKSSREVVRRGVVRFRKASPYPFWSADSRYILYSADASGREQQHVYAIDTENPDRPARDLTPFDGVTAYVHHVPSVESPFAFIAHNRRTSALFDLYQIDLRSGQEKLLFENSENIIHMLVSDDGKVLARVRQDERQRIVEVPSELPSAHPSAKWKALIRAGKFDVIYPMSLNKDGSGLYLLHNVGLDKTSLGLLDFESGEVEPIFSHPDVDLQRVLMSAIDKKPQLIHTEPDYPELHFFDENLRQRLQPFFQQGKNGVRITSMDRSETIATLVVFDHTGASFQLVNLETGASDVLAESTSRKNADVWVNKQPITFSARDGLEMHGYMSRPRDIDRPLPTVVLVHGGPWARDAWGFSTQVQFLVNRGYAVLQVNYRGSSGYGRRHLMAGAGEFAGKMHTDLLDGIDWAVAKGFTDPESVAIMGGSYGGYATLVGMTMTPDRFQCGIDFVGVSDLTILLETAPAYWKANEHWWHRFIGDPTDPEQREIMRKKSPVNFASQVKNPLLIVHGANDPRVVLEHADRMVAELRAADKEVDYVVVDDEGHGMQHWKHELAFYRKSEDFLAACLGGRSSGFDFYQLGSWAF